VLRVCVFADIPGRLCILFLMGTVALFFFFFGVTRVCFCGYTGPFVDIYGSHTELSHRAMALIQSHRGLALLSHRALTQRSHTELSHRALT